MKAHCPKCGRYSMYNQTGEKYRTTGHLWWKKTYTIKIHHLYCASCDHYFAETTEERLR